MQRILLNASFSDPMPKKLIIGFVKSSLDVILWEFQC